MRLPAAVPDPLARLAYKVAWRCLILWWRLARPHAQGAAVALVHRGSLLVVRPSYRAEWNLPGGLRDAGEDAATAAARELQEETGIMVPADTLIPLGPIAFSRFGARFEVALFGWWPETAPRPRADGREIVAARLLGPAELRTAPHGPDVGLLLEAHADRLFMVCNDSGAS